MLKSTGVQLDVRTVHSTEAILDALNLTAKAARKVTVRALNDTARWFKSNAGKELAKATGIPSTVLKKRFFIRKPSYQGLPVTATILVNLYDVRAKSLGNLTQMASGARAGKFTFDGAFVATMNAKRGQSIYKRKTRKRFPVREMGINIQAPAQPILDRLLSSAQGYYQQRFTHQLNYETGRMR